MQKIGPAIEKHPELNDPSIRNGLENETAWCYLFVHNRRVISFAERLKADGIIHFIHKSVIYRRNKNSRGIQTIEKPTISGLIFLQGKPRMVQNYLKEALPGYHLVKNCSTGMPAVIPDKVMRPFMRVLETSPERVRFLLRPFRYYVGGNVKLRLTSGFFAGLEGYVIRIDRDRRLVMNVGGMSVAISGVHCETFEVVDEPSGNTGKMSQQETPSVRVFTELQKRIDRELYEPVNQQEINIIADVLNIWKERSVILLEQWKVSQAKEILLFLLEEIDHYCSSLIMSGTFDMSPVITSARHIAAEIDRMTVNPHYTEETREELTADRDAALSCFGYLFGE